MECPEPLHFHAWICRLHSVSKIQVSHLNRSLTSLKNHGKNQSIQSLERKSFRSDLIEYHIVINLINSFENNCAGWKLIYEDRYYFVWPSPVFNWLPSRALSPLLPQGFCWWFHGTTDSNFPRYWHNLDDKTIAQIDFVWAKGANDEECERARSQTHFRKKKSYNRGGGLWRKKSGDTLSKKFFVWLKSINFSSRLKTLFYAV